MRATDYLGLYLNEQSQTLEQKTNTHRQKAKKNIATGLTMLMLGTAAVGVLNQEAFATQKQKNKQEQAISNIILGLGQETISQKTSDDESSNRFLSIKGNLLYSPDANTLINANIILDTMRNIYNSISEERINIFNARAGGLYTFAKPLTIGGELSYSSGSQFNTDFNNPFLDPRTKWTNQDIMLLGKLGVGGSGKNAYGALAIAGLHYQSQALKDNVPYAHFTQTKQDDLNYLLGFELFTYFGRDAESILEFITKLTCFNAYPLHRFTNKAVIPELIKGNVLDLKAIITARIARGLKAGIEFNLGTNSFDYKNNFRRTQDRFGIGGVISCNY